jgi:inosine-uridine nucleoside N-ribohydrolase
MKQKWIKPVVITFAVLAFLLILIWPAAPLWARLGAKPFCISGSWPHLKITSCSPQPEAPPAVTPRPLPTLSRQGPIPVIVDDDGSPDGMVALMYFLRNPNFDVRAVTISCGEAHPEVFAPHVQQLLTGLGRADIPVGAGRATPLDGNNAFPDPWRQASDDFWGITLSQNSASLKPTPAADLIVETINKSNQPVMVFVSGPHTNLAEALRIDPGIEDHILEVVIMGGSIYVPGNIQSDWQAINNTVAEWNIWADPLAAREVFNAGIPLHLIPLDATKQVVWTQSDLPGWISSNSPEGVMAGRLLQWMLDSWSSEGVYVWDLVAAVSATDPALCLEVPLSVEILVEPGPEQGRTAITDNPPNASVCLDPDIEQIKAMASFVMEQP